MSLCMEGVGGACCVQNQSNAVRYNKFAGVNDLWCNQLEILLDDDACVHAHRRIEFSGRRASETSILDLGRIRGKGGLRLFPSLRRLAPCLVLPAELNSPANKLQSSLREQTAYIQRVQSF